MSIGPASWGLKVIKLWNYIIQIANVCELVQQKVPKMLYLM